MPPACVRPGGRRGSSLAGPRRARLRGALRAAGAPAERVKTEVAEFSR